ncbi:hypothetical protein [Polyangium fumosum]|uniref:Tetratricopeptide repeat protein n=1 Tax=Polyangium fumosum TaxID=889272 RepID=A0A4V5PLU6_9BACT|nr:hypothetical protein [Polyangium fumosum]TKD00650.1 hypothetical protein E8A74_33530 [Polyangium fumosum]
MSPEEEEARERLLFHLENQTGFWFGLVVGDDPRPRARLCEAAAAWCKEHGRAFVLHEPEPDGLVQLAVELARGDSPGVHWIVADGVRGLVDVWNAGATQMLMAMNERREAYRKRLDGGIVVEGRSSLKRILREMAPDLFSIRAFIAEPGEEPKAASTDLPEWQEPFSLASMVSADDVDPDLALARLERLTMFEALATTEDWIDAELGATTSLYNTARYDEAERVARDLLSRLEASSVEPEKYAYQRAQACVILARIRILRADDTNEALDFWAEALRLLEAHSAREPDDALGCMLLTTRIAEEQAGLFVRMGEPYAAIQSLFAYVELILPESVVDLLPEMQTDLMGVYVRLAGLLAKHKDLDGAESTLRKAALIIQECASRHGEDPRWEFERLRNSVMLGQVQLAKKDRGSAAQTLVAVAALAKKLESYGEMRSPWRNVLERFYLDLARVLSFQVKYSDAVDRVRVRALSNLTRQFERTPDNVKLGWVLAQCHLKRAMLLEKEDVEGAKDSAQQALELVARLPVESDAEANLKGKIEALRAFVRKPGE